MRSFKPALARDYDVFFAAIGLLCGGILFFQGWRLDPILQFGQFLLAGTTVFFAYESVRLRGVATDQARRSSYFDEEIESPRSSPGGLRSRWDNDSYDRFEEPETIRRRFSSRGDIDEELSDDDFYGSRRPSRAAIPEAAESRINNNFSNEREQGFRERRNTQRSRKNEYRGEKSSDFGDRRNTRQEVRRGSRPLANSRTSMRRDSAPTNRTRSSFQSKPSSIRQPDVKDSVRFDAEDAAFSASKNRSDSNKKNLSSRGQSQQNRKNSSPNPGRYNQKPPESRRPRDNSSRFDD